MYFRPLESDDLQTIRELHSEWFPLNYPDSFYDKILIKTGIIAIGCFISVPIIEENELNSQDSSINNKKIRNK